MPFLNRLETLFGLLLPSACREHVLGDLHEKCRSPREYLVEALSVLGPVIVSRIRRTADLQVFLMETFAVYLSFTLAAWWLGQRAFLFDHNGFARLAIPTTVTVVGLLLSNAYANPKKPRSWKEPILESARSLSLGLFGQAAIFDSRPSFAVPFGIMAYGSCLSLVLVSSMRMLFPPILDKRDRLHRPALVSNELPLEGIRTRIKGAVVPVRLRSTTLWAVALLIILSLLTMDGEVLTPRSAVHVLIVGLVIFALRLRE